MSDSADATASTDADPAPSTQVQDPAAAAAAAAQREYDDNHPPFSLIPFDATKMSYEEYVTQYERAIMSKLQAMKPQGY
jgi:hypothetical protein